MRKKPVGARQVRRWLYNITGNHRLNLTVECQTESLSKVCMPFSLDCHHCRVGTESSLHSQHLVKFKKEQLKVFYVSRQTRHGKVNANVNITNFEETNRELKETACSGLCSSFHLPGLCLHPLPQQRSD